MTYTLWTGESSGFFWISSNASIALELLAECPDIFEAKYIVMPTFDGVSLIDNRGTQSHRMWMDIGAPRIVASLKEIPWTGNGEELYIFDRMPDDESVESIQAFCTEHSFEGDSEQETKNFLKHLITTSAESYSSQHQHFFFATSKQSLFDTVMSCSTVQQLPQRHQIETQQRERAELEQLGPECGPEKCRRSDCNRLRIELGVFCREHHLLMLRSSRSDIDD